MKKTRLLYENCKRIVHECPNEIITRGYDDDFCAELDFGAYCAARRLLDVLRVSMRFPWWSADVNFLLYNGYLSTDLWALLTQEN